MEKIHRTPYQGEIHRIVNLPIVTQSADVEQVSQEILFPYVYDEGFRLFPTQADAIQGFKQNGGLFAPAPVGTGKCVCEDVEFYDLLKGRRKVDEQGSATIPSVDHGKIFVKTASVFPSGIKQCAQLNLSSGEELRGSLDHPVLTTNGWRELGSLQKGDLVATPRSLPEPEIPFKVSDDELIFIAYLMADGSTTTSTPAFTKMEGEIWAEMKEVLGRLGGKLGKYRKDGKADTYNLLNVFEIVRKWGISGCKSTNKRLPKSWYCLSDRQCALFLSRFLACDAYFNPERGIMELGLANKGLLRDIKHLLLRRGITSRTYYKQATCKGKKFDSWRLIVDRKQTVDLINILGWIPDRAHQIEPILRIKKKYNTDVDVVPISVKEMQEIYDEMGLPGLGGCYKKRKLWQGPTRCEINSFVHPTKGQKIGRKKFHEFCVKFKYEGKYKWLANSDLIWSAVDGVEDIGPQKVYDLNVPGTNSWIGNHIVIHNTLISLMCASHAYSQGIKKILLLIPSPLVEQLTKRDLQWARKKFPMTCPVRILAGKPKTQRLAVAKSKAPGLYISTYSLLSTVDAVDLLNSVDPGLIILDECHYVKEYRTPRTKRLFNFIKEKQPQLVAMSGTITSKTIKEYHHIIRACLDEGSPLPRSVNQMMDLAELVDAGVESITGQQAAPWEPFRQWARQNFSEERYPGISSGFRKAFQKRFLSASGVVKGEDAEVNASILVETLDCPAPEKKLTEYMAKVTDEYLTPDGEEIECAMLTHKWLFELTAGFYNNLVWPSSEDLARRKNIGPRDARHLLKRSQTWHEAQQEYFKVLRPFLQGYPPAGLETPLAVAKNMSVHESRDVDRCVYDRWKAAKDLDFIGRVERDSIPVRVDPYKINVAKQWAADKKGGIIWVHHQEIGKWLKEELPHALYCPAGTKEIEDPANANKICIASIAAHSTGKNLQHFTDQLFLQLPRPSKTMEQALGRLHRPGQLADCVGVSIFRATEFDHACLAACLKDTNYVQQTTGTRMKLLLADWDPLPKNISQEILREMGFKLLTSRNFEV